MKEIEKLAKEERQKILKDDTFLENELIPLVNNKPKKVCWKLSMIYLPVIVLIICVSIFLPICFKDNSGYSGLSATKISSAVDLNNSLVKTQVSGEFQSVVLTYYKKNDKPVFFTVNQELISDEFLIDCEFDIIIDKKYKPVLVNCEFTQSIKFLDYIVKYCINEKQGDGMYEYSIFAYLDTAQERYYFKYNEVSINKICYFAQYLEKLINKI